MNIDSQLNRLYAKGCQNDATMTERDAVTSFAIAKIATTT
jgi:hypothetical protein